jgi:hypothetical protein
VSAEVVVDLSAVQFGERERVLLRYGPLSASAFRYESGVAAVRLGNERGEAVLLPFQGQQVWSARFYGRELGMRSMFAEPRPTREYLENYGGLLLHCGLTAMGVPGPEDRHPLHGELPNAPFQRAWLFAGSDGRGQYLGLGGEYEHIVAFSHHYVARPLVRLRAGAALLEVEFAARNLKRTQMEYMYLAHINLRPVDNGRLLYSAPCAPGRVRVRRSIPAHVRVRAGYREFLEELERQPERHNVLLPELPFDPEVVLYLDYLADEEGWAHSLQVHPDGSADYVAHRPAQLPKGIRWICRTPDQDALGLVLPATAEPEGYTAESAKGNVRVLPPGGEFRCQYTFGVLSAEEASEVGRRIERLLRSSAQ